MYKIEKIPTRKHGFTREQINIIALRLLTAVNECEADLQLEKKPGRRCNKKLIKSYMVSTENFDYPAEEYYEAIKIYVPMSNCVLTIEPTTEAINTILKRLGIKFVEVL